MTSLLRNYKVYDAQTRAIPGDTKTSLMEEDHFGWIKCDGRELSATTYRLLFNVIGYSFGGSDGQFNLPNPAGRVAGFLNIPGLSGYDATLSTRIMGDICGEETHTLTIAEMPAHNHGVSGELQDPSNNLTSSYIHNHGGQTGEGGSAAESENAAAVVIGSVNVAGSNSHTHSISNDTHNHTLHAAGGSQPHNNMQPTLFTGNMFVYAGTLYDPVTKRYVGNHPANYGII